MKRRFFALMIFVLPILGVGILLRGMPAFALNIVPQATFTVDSTTDAVDANIGDGQCATAIGECTLRAAVQETNVLAGLDMIIIPAGIYTITIPTTYEDEAIDGDLDILDDLIISGAGQIETVLDGNQIESIFQTVPSVNVSISNLTIQNARVSGISSFSNLVLDNLLITQNFGRGLTHYYGTLSIDNTTFSFNSPTIDYPSGGGLFTYDSEYHISNSTFYSNSKGAIKQDFYSIGTISNTIIYENYSPSGGIIGLSAFGSLKLHNTSVFSNSSETGATIDVSNLIVEDSEIYDNDSPIIIESSLLSFRNSYIHHNNGTGFYIRHGNHITIENSTISSNRGGILIVEGDLGIKNSTISHNSSNYDNTIGINGGIFVYDIASNTSITNTSIISNDGIGFQTFSEELTTFTNNLFAFNDDGDCSFSINAVLLTAYNIASDSSCNFTGAGDMNVVNPLVNGLQNNGGNTPTFALMDGSVAINAGTNTNCPATDQRGITRPQNGTCDIGAYEATAPISLTATLPMSDTAHLTWTDAGYDGYTLWRSENPYMGFSLLAEYGGFETNVAVDVMQPYFYEVYGKQGTILAIQSNRVGVFSFNITAGN